VVASLIETCKLVGIEPHGYLADVITRTVNAPTEPARRTLAFVLPGCPNDSAYNEPAIARRNFRRPSSGEWPGAWTGRRNWPMLIWKTLFSRVKPLRCSRYHSNI
jgi:hypothetical protein